MAFIKDSFSSQIKLRQDLMSKEFPSIWIELTNPIQKNLILGGFYRQWTSESCKKEEAEEQGINIFIDQLEKATNEDKKVLIMGDANLCSNTWKEAHFLHKKIGNMLLETLEPTGLT